MSDSRAALPAGAWTGIRLVAGRELGAYFDSNIAYVYTIAFVVLTNTIFMNEFFLAGTLEMSAFFELLPLLLSVFLPAVTMRLWAEERKQGTIELLLTLPIHPLQAILGKYVAALGLYLLFLAGSAPIVVMLLVLGSPDLGPILSGYLGLFLLGAMFLALGMCLSALSSDQIIAFVLGMVACSLLVLGGDDRVVAVVDGLAPALGAGTLFYETVSIAPRYQPFVRGVIELPAVAYFVLQTALYLWINAILLARLRS
ncbi:MAG TPA: ABC transporter permease [Thermoanaerobaculia bacterium]|nr:ABC transporter permease [Thermoanaerobaculia bacterium]